MPSQTDCAGSVAEVAGACWEGVVCSARADEQKATAATRIRAGIALFIFITSVLTSAAANTHTYSGSHGPQSDFAPNSVDCTLYTRPCRDRKSVVYGKCRARLAA